MNHSYELSKGLDLDFDLLINRVRCAGRPGISAKRFAEVFNYQSDDLYRLAHVSSATATDASASPRLQAFMLHSLQVIDAMSFVFNDMIEAVSWYKTNCLEEFEKQTPEQMVSAGGYKALIMHLRNSRAVDFSGSSDQGQTRPRI